MLLAPNKRQVWFIRKAITLQWRHHGHGSVSNHQPHDCLLSRLFRRRSKKTLKLRVTGLCAGNSAGTGDFPAQMASYMENVSIWWRHNHDNETGRGWGWGWGNEVNWLNNYGLPITEIYKLYCSWARLRVCNAGERLLQLGTAGVNTLRPRRNERHFADDIFKRIFFNENVWISNKISLKFVRTGPINNIPGLVQIIAWRRLSNKPLSEPMMVRLPTHICVTRPQWV